MKKFNLIFFLILLIYMCFLFVLLSSQIAEMTQNLALQSQLTRETIELNSLILDEFWEWRWQNLSEREKASILNYCEKKGKKEIISDGIPWGANPELLEGE